MALGIAGIVFIVILAYWLRKATRGTPFKNCMGCTPNINQLAHLERGRQAQGRKER
ncbi:MAG: hypothetical protein HDQ44_05105 [Desulfovibrio sp.]|nr:hypothetical protein [Desulfovibrio sp.]